MTPERGHRDETSGISISLDIDRSSTLTTVQTSLRDLSNWSVGPSFRGYVSNADSYVRIRVEGF